MKNKPSHCAPEALNEFLARKSLAMNANPPCLLIMCQ